VNANVEIHELQEMDEMTLQNLIELLIEVVDDGASVGFLSPLGKEESRTYWEEAMGPGVRLWIAKQRGQIVGTVQLQLAMKRNASHRAEVAKLMIAPNARRQGIARLLMREAEETAAMLGRTLLILDTRAGDPSNRLYRSLGFTEAGTIPMYARSSNGEMDGTVFFYKVSPSISSAKV
jgi:ribosomal protein S18 acetylase RimI-like enzyme